MSKDTIYRQDAIDAIFGRSHEIIKMRIGNLPSAQPEWKGHWIDMGDFEQCSACTGTRLKEVNTFYGKAIWIKTPYCPNCGAKMEGEQDE